MVVPGWSVLGSGWFRVVGGFVIIAEVWWYLVVWFWWYGSGLLAMRDMCSVVLCLPRFAGVGWFPVGLV